MRYYITLLFIGAIIYGVASQYSDAIVYVNTEVIEQIQEDLEEIKRSQRSEESTLNVIRGYLEPSPMEVIEITNPEDFEIATTTAYSEFDSCHYPNCAMASGKPAYIGAVACPRDIPLGTEVEIAGQPFTCEDRTAKRYDGRFDIFTGYGEDAYKLAINFGIKKLPVEVK